MSPRQRPLFCVIDASSFIFRAYYAVRPLSNKAGTPTNAVFGFAQMILSVLSDTKPDYIAVVYDTKYPSFRKEMYPEYKANRSAMPDDLVPQIPYIKKLIEALGLPAFEQPGFEADDIIATLVDQAGHQDKEVDTWIVSSDKDLMQLVNEHVKLYDTMKNTKLGPAEVLEKLGVPPEKVTDYLGIVGDTSDNIPGVKGIGPKGAKTLLDEYGSMEGVYENLAKIANNNLRTKLEASRDLAFLSKELATVKRDMTLEKTWRDLACKPRFGIELKEVLEELDFHSLAKRLTGGAGAETDITETETESTAEPPSSAVSAPVVRSGDQVAALDPAYHSLQTKAQLQSVLERLAAAEYIAFDTETTSLQPRNTTLVGFSFCAGAKEAFYVPLSHRDQLGSLLPEQMPAGEALSMFAAFLKGKKLIGQNIKFDWNVLRGAGVVLDPAQIEFDTMLASYILSPESRHGLDVLAEQYLGHKNISYEELCGTGKSQKSFAEVPIADAAKYAAEDAHVTFLLAEQLRPALKSNKSLEAVFRTIELPLVAVLADIEWEGIAIDEPLLKKMSAEFGQQMAKLETKAQELAGEPFNLSSPKQLQKILFEKLKLPTAKKTKTGFSTDVEVLEKLASLHDLPKTILEHRELAKLKGTYVDVLPEIALPETKRVHTSFHQAVAATGRLSSSDPNLQNIPIRTESGRRIRGAFVAKPGCVLVGADYSQIELRILASLSEDASLTEAFNKGVDVHAQTAAQIFGVPLKDVDSDQRRKAKAVNFGLLYGKSAFSLAEELEISRGEAASIIEKYFAQYPTIKNFLSGLVNTAREKGYAETLYGRRRPLESLKANNKMIQAQGERMALNTPIQGTAADVIKLAMLDLWQALREQKFAAKILLQVHDELVLEVPEAELSAVQKLVKDKMEGVGRKPGFPEISVPLAVDCGAGKNWLEL